MYRPGATGKKKINLGGVKAQAKVEDRERLLRRLESERQQRALEKKRNKCALRIQVQLFF